MLRGEIAGVDAPAECASAWLAVALNRLDDDPGHGAFALRIEEANRVFRDARAASGEERYSGGGPTSVAASGCPASARV